VSVIIHSGVCAQLKELKVSDLDASSSPPSSPMAVPAHGDASLAEENGALPYGHFKWTSSGEGWGCMGDGEDCQLLVSH